MTVDQFLERTINRHVKSPSFRQETEQKIRRNWNKIVTAVCDDKFDIQEAVALLNEGDIILHCNNEEFRRDVMRCFYILRAKRRLL